MDILINKYQQDNYKYRLKIQSDDLLTTLRKVELSRKWNIFYLKSDGKKLTFRDRNFRLTNTTTPSVTFGQGVGELPYVDIISSFDDNKIINTVQRTRTGGSTQI